MQLYTFFKGLRSFLIPLFFASSYLQANVEQCCCETFNFFAIGEYLYWNTNISGLEANFGKSSLAQTTTDNATLAETTTFDRDPHFDWNSGYRIGIGMQLPNENITVEAIWTQFSNCIHRKSSGNNRIVNHAHAKVSLEQIDTLLAYNCAYSTLNVKPFIGIRAAKVNHRVKSTLTTDVNIIPNAFAIGIDEFNGHQHFKGIGPMLGLYGDWTIGYGFGLYGEAAFSILYGDYRIHSDNSEVFSSPISLGSTAHLHKHLHRFNNTLDLGLGLFWRTSIKCIDIGICLGYELHEYYNISYVGAAYRGDIAFNGGVFSLEVGF
jgi:hypothetical protein